MSETLFRLGPRLREARLSVTPALSQKTLAEVAARRGAPGLNPGVVSRMELGYRDATWPEVLALAGALKADPDWLAGRERTPPREKAAPGPSAARSGTSTRAPEPAAAVALPSPAASAPASAGAAEHRVDAMATAPAARPALPASPVPSPPIAAAAAAADPRLPPAELPETGNGDLLSRRRTLVQQLERARQALGDRSLPPAVWRAWRAYDERVRERLRELDRL